MQQNNGIDKKQMISFAVLCLILFGAMFYFQNKQMKEEELKAQQQKTEQVKNAVKQAQATNINPNVTPGAIQTANLSNKELNIEFSSLGGQVSKVQLSEYKAYNNKTDQADLPLYLINKNNSNYGFQFKDKTGKVINTKDLVFTPAVNGNAVTMTANYNGAVIQFIYTLLPKYTLDFKVRTQGLSAVTSDNKADFIWDYNVRNLEKGRAQEQSHSEFSYAFNNYKDYDYDGRTTMDEEKETLNWIGVKQQFFSSVIEAKNGFTQSKGNQENVEEGEYLKKFNYEGFVQMTGSELNQDFTWYFMPLDLPLLKSYDKNFDEILPLGWSFIGAMNRYFFMWLYAIIASWGLSGLGNLCHDDHCKINLISDYVQAA